MKEDFLIRLKEILKSLIPVDDELYEKMLPYLEDQEYPAGTILKQAGKTEVKARLILKGIICEYEQLADGRIVAQKIYFPGQIVFDIHSYIDQRPSKTILTTKTDVDTVEITKENENRLLMEVPEVSNLAVRINHELTKNLIRWENILKLPKVEAYEAIIRMYPNIGNIIPVKDFEGILRKSKSTISRIRNRK